MNTPKRGADAPSGSTTGTASLDTQARYEAEAIAAETQEHTPRRIELNADTYPRKQGTRAPSAKHFERLEACVQEALDEKDEFSRRQALSILDGIRALLEPDVSL